MNTKKQRNDKKGVLLFTLLSFFLLFLMFSFSIDNVYGFSNDIITNSDNISFSNDLNQSNISLKNNLNFSNDSIQNSNETNNSESSNDTSDVINLADSSSINQLNHNKAKSSASNATLAGYLNHESDYYADNNLNNNYENKNNYYLLNKSENIDNIDKTDELKGSTNLSNIDFNNSYFIFQNYDPNFNYYDYFNAIINNVSYNNVFLISSSHFNGNGFNSFNNIIKELSNINFIKIDNNDNSVIFDFQSDERPTLTILFFIKFFMKNHDNCKEHLNSF